MSDQRCNYYIGFVLIAVLFTFLPILNFSFLNWDDPQYVTNNPLIRSLSLNNLTDIFTTKTYDVYSPLTILSFAVEYYFFELNPFYYHLTNLLLHLSIVFCIYILALQMGLNNTGAAFAALLFGIHPIHVDSLVWITERKGLLYTFFYLLSVIAYGQFLKTDRKQMYLISVVLGLLSVLAKPMALTLPLTLCLCDWWAGRKDWKAVIVSKIPYCLYLLPIVWITFAVNQDMYASGIDWFSSLLICLWTFSFYIIKFFWPLNLSPVYELPLPVTLQQSEYVLTCLVFILFIGFFIYFRRNRWIMFANLFYVFNIFYLLRFDLVTKPDMVSDRYMYLASLGFCLLFGQGIHWLWSQVRNHKVTLIGCSVIIFLAIFLLMAQSRRYSLVWKNSYVFWNYVIEKAGSFEVAYHNRALLFIEQMDYDAALIDLNKAIEVYPRYANAYFSRAVLLERRGDEEKALNDYQRAREINPRDHRAYNNRANLLIRQNDLNAALAELNLYLKNYGKHPEIYVNRGLIYKKLGQWDQALSDFTEAIRLRPDLAQAYNNRGNLYKEKGDFNQALNDYNIGLKYDPDNRTIAANKAEVSELKRRRQGAD